MEKRIISLIGFLFCLSLLLSPVQAQTNQSQQQASGSPLTYKLSAKPGQTLNQVTSVTNFKDQTIQVQAGVLDFEVVDEEGNIKFNNVVDNQHKLASWIRIPEPNFALNKNETKQVNFDVVVPANATPGAHWATILFQSYNTSGEKKIETLGGAGALILLTVEDSLKEEAVVKSFTASRKTGQPALAIALRISNTGENFIRPKGTLVITNLWGRKVDEIPLKDAFILPGTISKIITEWKPEKGLSIGRYKVELKGYYGSKNAEFSATDSVWIMPWEAKWVKYVLLIIVILILIFLFFKSFKLEIRKKRVKNK